MYYHAWGLPWLIAAVVGIIPFWRICNRVGHSPWLSLLMAVPLVNVIFIYFLAFSEWPSQKSAPAATP
ncbi:MAG: hypothetical protein WAK94_17700 [Steroidobacteraceae bacterium]|jgi:hypothetical protein|nr:hypothetical protein [Steroidobacteraceae bacterium]